MMTFTWIAIPNILSFKLTMRYNYYPNSNNSTIISLNSTLIMVVLDKYYINSNDSRTLQL